jgi:PKD repeat protein
MGCDEYHTGAVTGPLTVVLGANFTNTTVGYPLSLTALIGGRTTGSVWDFGDGVVVSNRPYASHAWAVPGDYSVALRAYNSDPAHS